MCGMYIMNGVHEPEPRSSSSNPQVSALIPRPAFNVMERMCQRHGSNQNSHPPVLVRKPLCNQFIHYYISSRRVFGINRFKLCNFAVVAIECSFATVYRGSIMARILRWSVMIYGSLQAEFMEIGIQTVLEHDRNLSQINIYRWSYGCTTASASDNKKRWIKDAPHTHTRQTNLSFLICSKLNKILYVNMVINPEWNWHTSVLWVLDY